MRISKSGKLTVSLTCESASPGSRRFPRHANQQVREADGFPDMRISKSGKLTVSLTCESASPGSRCFQKNLDSAVNPERRPMFDSSLSHSFLLPQRNCASVGTARALGGDNKKSPTENLAAANTHEVITRVRL